MVTVSSMQTNLNRRGMPSDYNTYAIKWIDQAENLMWNAHEWRYKHEGPVAWTGVAASSATYAVTGIASDMELLDYMYDTTHNLKLDYVPKWRILEEDPDLSVGGNPKWFCYEDEGNVIRLYPEPDAAQSYQVHYWKQRTEMTATTASPTMPTRYHDVIEDGAYALYLAYEFGSNDGRAQAAWNTFIYGSPIWRRGLRVMGGVEGAWIKENRMFGHGYSQTKDTDQIL